MFGRAPFPVGISEPGIRTRNSLFVLLWMRAIIASNNWYSKALPPVRGVNRLPESSYCLVPLEC